ncbi:hypothetical protein JW933_12000 [candidate division FCPU426 bacterium]|nr:hypothetical protein [candidate division FCPU426 bacterium]
MLDQKHILFFCGLLLETCLAAPVYAAWTQLGGSLNFDGNHEASDPCLAIDGHTPYVAWSELDTSANRYNIFVKYWNGSSWVLLDPARQPLNFSPSLNVFYPRLAVANGVPYVTWAEIYKVYVKACTYGSWAQVGAAALNMDANNSAYLPDIAIANNAPYVVWHEWSTYKQIFAKYFNGYEWLPVSGATDCLNDDPNTNAVSARIAFVQTTPHVTWQEEKGIAHTQSIYTKCYSGSQWAYASGTAASLNVNANPDYHALNPAIAGNGSTPYIAWRERKLDGRFGIRIKAFTGSQWQRLENEPDGLITYFDHTAYYPGVAVAGNVPCLVWQEQNTAGPERYIQMRYYNGADWQGMGNDPAPLQLDANQGATAPCLAAADDRVYVAWQESDGSHNQIYVKQAAFPPTPTVTPTASATATAASSVPASAREGYAAPNPFVPTRGQKTYFHFSPATGSPYRIRIFNIKGQIVRTLNSEDEWDGRTDFGNLCEGGEYFFQIEAEANRRITGKVVLIK